MDYYEKDKEYKKDKYHKKPVIWHFLGFLALGFVLLLALLFFFKPQPVPPPAGEPAFGSLYGDDEPVDDAVTGDRVDFDFPGPFLNTDPDPEADEIVIESSGVYEISADVIVETNGNSSAVFQIVVNDTPIEGSTFQADLVGNTTVTVGKTIQAELNEGDTVAVEIVTFTGQNLEYESASLTVNRIGPLVDTE